MKKVYYSMVGLLGMLFLLLTGCAKNVKTVTGNNFYFDTVISIQIQHTDGEALLEECFSICAEMENIFSRTKEESELYKLNHRTENMVTVSDDLARLITLGLEFGEFSDGLFDITIAPVADLWNFKQEDGVIPDDVLIQQAVSKVDYTKVHIDGNIVTFDSKDTMIDLGAIAKGYIADRLKEFLEQKGVKSGTINLGGNALVIGEREENQPWKVGIQKPFADRNETIMIIEATDKSVVSSGVYERYFEKDGKIYHHILNPKTGYPEDTDLWQVTIVSDESVFGDLLSTTCMLMGYENAKEFLKGYPEVKAYFVDNTGTLRS